jgi:cation transport ATPase
MDITAPDMMVRWRSTSGVGLGLLLIYGVLNVASAVVVPIALEARAVQGLGDGAVIFSRSAEEYMLGTTYAQLHHDNPKLDKLLVDSMLAMCAQMMAMAVAFLGIAWFGARRGARWAPWVLLVSGVIWVPYYFVIASDFAALGAKDTFMDAVMVSVFAIPAVVGSVLMLVASRGNDRSPVNVR